MLDSQMFRTRTAQFCFKLPPACRRPLERLRPAPRRRGPGAKRFCWKLRHQTMRIMISVFDATLLHKFSFKRSQVLKPKKGKHMTMRDYAVAVLQKMSDCAFFEHWQVRFWVLALGFRLVFTWRMSFCAKKVQRRKAIKIMRKTEVLRTNLEAWDRNLGKPIIWAQKRNKM